MDGSLISTKDETVCCKKSPTIKRLINKVPNDILENEELNTAIRIALPKNYQFEIHKTLWRIRQEKARHIGLQFPEGLLFFAHQIGTILTHFSDGPIDVTILGDVTYGACCIDDLTARSIGIDLLIHYGHSCLIPVDQTTLKCLYVFVDIVLDFKPLVSAITKHFPNRSLNQSRPSNPSFQEAVSSPSSTDISQSLLSSDTSNLSPCEISNPSSSLNCNGESKVLLQPEAASKLDSHYGNITYDLTPVIVLMGTIQYSTVLHATASALREIYGTENIIVPQEQPLTGGEVLGCTSPNLRLNLSSHLSSPTRNDPTLCIFISDGRFHLESAMIHNPSLPFIRYDPFTKKLFREYYDHSSLHQNRKLAIEEAKTARSVGIILGTLGRQGSVGIFERLYTLLRERSIKTTLLLMSEIMPDRLQRLSKSIDAFIQVACPRLSLDWGHYFGSTPLLTPYEAFVAYSYDVEYKEVYPMDFYSKNGGPWSNFKQEHRSGSLVSKFGPSSLSDLEKRRALIRQRAEERKKRLEHIM